VSRTTHGKSSPDAGRTASRCFATRCASSPASQARAGEASRRRPRGRRRCESRGSRRR
jgi:hypothetical protein